MVVLLTTVEDVKREGRLSSEYTDGEIGSEIAAVSVILAKQYGSPFERSWVQLDDDFLTYDINADHNPIYAVDRVVLVDVNDIASISTGSVLASPTDYSVNLDIGDVTFDNSIVTGSSNGWVVIEWTPEVMHWLATYEAALGLIDDTQVINGETVTSPQAKKLTRRITEIRQSLRPQTIASSKYKSPVRRLSQGFWVEHERSYNPLE